MMHLFINSLAASAGGGLTYIRNVLPHLATQLDLNVTVALSPAFGKSFAISAIFNLSSRRSRLRAASGTNSRSFPI